MYIIMRYEDDRGAWVAIKGHTYQSWDMAARIVAEDLPRGQRYSIIYSSPRRKARRLR